MKKKLFILALLILSSFQIIAKNPSIGTIYNRIGNQSSIDIPSLNGFTLAFDQLQHAQNPLISNLKFIFVDGKTDEKWISQEAQKLYKMTDLIAIVGLSDDDMARAVASEARKAKKIFITSGATSPLLTQEFPTYTFLVAFGNNTQAAALAEYAKDTLKIENCLILHDADMLYARFIAGYFTERFTKSGGVVLARDAFSLKDMGFSTQIQKIKDLKPQMIYLAAGPEDAQALIREIRSAGIMVPIFGGDSFDTPLLTDQGSNIFYASHVFLNPESKDPLVVKFIEAYRHKYGTDPDTSFAALGYDACNLFVQALEQAASPRPEDLLNSLNSIQFTGVTGEIHYNDRTHTPLKAVSIISINQGKRTEVARFVPNDIPPPSLGVQIRPK